MTTTSTPPRSPALAADPVEQLRTAVPDLWHELGPMCREVAVDDVDALCARLRTYLADDEHHAEHAGELGNELLALRAGWAHFTPGQRAVLAGAMTYLLTSDDVRPDTLPGGLDDDDRVVHACVRILVRRTS